MAETEELRAESTYKFIKDLCEENEVKILKLLFVSCTSENCNTTLKDNVKNIERLKWLASGIKLFEEDPPVLNELKERIIKEIELLENDVKNLCASDENAKED